MKYQPFSIVACIFFLICGCTLYKKPEVPQIKTPLQFKVSLHQINKRLKDNWWENFQDQNLNQLVSRALANNYNYQIAIKNIDIAKTYIAQNKSGLYPQVNLGFNPTRNKAMNVFNNSPKTLPLNVVETSTGLAGSGQIFNLAQLSASVSYEIDIWNQVGNSVHQAEMNTQANTAESQVIKLSLISDVVNTYFQITTLNDNLNNLNQQREIASNILQLTSDQYKSGLIDETSVEDARNQIENINTLITNTTKQERTLENSLAYLVGEYPETFILKTTHSLQGLNCSSLIPSGLPAKMLANRPDIQEAFFQMMAYGYAEKQSIANFLPSFNLTGSYGYASQMLANLISNGNAFWSIGGNVVQPLFDYQLRKSEHERAHLQLQSAILSYKNSVANAFNEIDSALASYQENSKALVSLQQVTHNNQEKLNLVYSQYQSGLVDYSNYLTLRLAYLQSNYNLINQKLVVMGDIVQVYKTLGIGL
jgi:multidrug efflux system outer membrane protein